MANPYINSVSFGNQQQAGPSGYAPPQIDFNAYGLGGGQGGAGQAPQQSQGGSLGQLLQKKVVGKIENKAASYLKGKLFGPQTVPASVEFPNGVNAPLGAASVASDAGMYAPAAYDAATGVSGSGLGAGAMAAQGVGDLAAASGAPAAMSSLASGVPALPDSVFGLGGTGTGAGSGSLGATSSGAGAPAGAGAGGAGTAVAGGAAALWAYALMRAIQTDKWDSTPMAQYAIMSQSGPGGQHVADTMRSYASKYGDLNNEASYDISKWSPADQAAVNYGHLSLQKKGGVGHTLGN